MCYSGATPGQSVEEEGAVEGVQERQQPQGLPARGRQLASLQLVQQVRSESYAYVHTPNSFLIPLLWNAHRGWRLFFCECDEVREILNTWLLLMPALCKFHLLCIQLKKDWRWTELTECIAVKLDINGQVNAVNLF